MKKIAFIFSILALSVSCSKQMTPDASDAAAGDCIVTVVPTGEITSTESELSTKAGTVSNSIYAAQVYQDGNRYAWGFFDDLSTLKLNLKQGYNYSIRMCMVKDVKSMINYYSLTNGGLRSGGTDGPFHDNDYISSNYYIALNRFNYNAVNYVFYIGATATGITSSTSYASSIELTHIREGYLNGTRYPECVDWFYGESASFTPSGETDTVELPLKRSGFKLKYELSGVTDGEVTVTIKNSDRTFFSNTTTTPTYSSDTKFITFYDTYSAWRYADNYTEKVDVTVTWKRGLGITQNLGTKSVQIKRNCLNNIKIRLGSDDRGAGMNLTAEDEGSMGSAENNLKVE